MVEATEKHDDAAAAGSPQLLSRKQMSDARLPLAYRDSCAHLLVPLNRCRFEQYYLPWRCQVRSFSFFSPPY
jgi:NADH dehydrogenase (ubiquinone) 1 beta subcomplex subunit 7